MTRRQRATHRALEQRIAGEDPSVVDVVDDECQHSFRVPRRMQRLDAEPATGDDTAVGDGLVVGTVEKVRLRRGNEHRTAIRLHEEVVEADVVDVVVGAQQVRDGEVVGGNETGERRGRPAGVNDHGAAAGLVADHEAIRQVLLVECPLHDHRKCSWISLLL